MQLQQPATQILTALLLQKRRWDRPLGTVHFATVKCQLIQQFCDHPSHKICNSISEMNSAFQFALARSSGHSEGCHHVKLLQPRVNAVRQILHSGTPNEDKLGFTKFQFQLLLNSFAFGSHALHMANLFVLKRTQIPSFVMLWGKSECPQKFKSLVDSHSFGWSSPDTSRGGSDPVSISTLLLSRKMWICYDSSRFMKSADHSHRFVPMSSLVPCHIRT